MEVFNLLNLFNPFNLLNLQLKTSQTYNSNKWTF